MSCAGRHDREAAAEGGEDRALLVAVHRADAQQPGRGGRLLAHRHAVVAGGGDHDDSGVERAADRRVDLVAAHGAEDRDLRPEREVDHVGAVGPRVVDAGGDVVSGAGSLVAQHPHGHHLRAGRHAGDADPVAGGGGDDPAHVRAVAVAVLRSGVVLDEVAPGSELPGEVGVVGLRARVHHGDDRAGAGGRRVGGVGLDEVEVELLSAPRVLREGGGGGEGERDERENDAPHGGVAMPAGWRRYTCT